RCASWSLNSATFAARSAPLSGAGGAAGMCLTVPRGGRMGRPGGGGGSRLGERVCRGARLARPRGGGAPLAAGGTGLWRVAGGGGKRAAVLGDEGDPHHDASWCLLPPWHRVGPVVAQ